MRCASFLAIHGDQIVAGFHLEAGLGEGRARSVVPVFAGVDFRDAVVAAVGLEIGAKHADADMQRFVG